MSIYSHRFVIWKNPMMPFQLNVIGRHVIDSDVLPMSKHKVQLFEIDHEAIGHV